MTHLFETIATQLKLVVNVEFIRSIKTIQGNTQSSERIVIQKIRDVFDDMGLSYQEASSQQSKDFRNVGGIGMNIEIKKTDSSIVYFNDTCPSSDIYYIIFFTGKEYKTKTSIPPQLLFINGYEFISDSPWIGEYIIELNALKDKYSRGENKKLLQGIMEVYPRPTFKANITKFLQFAEP